MGVDLEVIVDDVIYQIQSHGGISRLFSEILPRMCDLDDSLRITLLTEGNLRQPLPEHGRIIRQVFPYCLLLLASRLGVIGEVAVRIWRPEHSDLFLCISLQSWFNRLCRDLMKVFNQMSSWRALGSVQIRRVEVPLALG